MKFLEAFFFAIIIYAFSNGSQAQKPASNPLQLTIANRNASEGYDLNLSARLISKWQKIIAYSNDFTWGQLTVSNFAFILVELQQKVGGKYKEVLLNAYI